MSIKRIHKYNSFTPRDYLDNYYIEVGEENKQILSFLHKILKKANTSYKRTLDFGCGPTVYPGLVVVPWTESIFFSEFLSSNRDEVKRWLEMHENGFKWDKFTEYALKLESERGHTISPEMIVQRESELRNKTVGIFEGDVFQNTPMGEKYNSYFDLLISNFVVDSVTDSHSEYKRILRNLVSLLRPGGRIVLSSIIGAYHYKIGTKHFVAVNLNKEFIRKSLIELNFDEDSIEEMSIDADIKSIYDKGYKGYDELHLITAQLSK